MNLTDEEIDLIHWALSLLQAEVSPKTAEAPAWEFDRYEKTAALRQKFFDMRGGKRGERPGEGQ